MRIGIMLRHMTQHGGGVLVYTENLLREMLELESPHEFVLLYRDASQMGRFGDLDRVEEVLVESPHILLWDQWSMRQIARRQKLDLIFNPKYSVPLYADCKTVFVSHGMDWYVMPWGSKWADRMSHRHLIPRYARSADHIIAVSDTTRNHLIEFLGLPESKVQTIYLGVDEAFRRTKTEAELESVRSHYKLPEKFFLYAGQIYPPKNFGRLVRAYAQVGPELGIPLVVAGKHTWLCEDEVGEIDRLGIADWVIRPGWIDRDAIPGFFALAHALLMPSLYEACPLPIIEAMASGCAVVAGNRHGTAELAGDAGVLVDPDEVDDIAAGIRRIATDPALRESLIENGHRRASEFSWPKCARQTLDVLDNVLR